MIPDVTDLPRKITLRQLRTFDAIARSGSFSEAAALLHVTQPAVSMQVKELESHCGLALYERLGRGIELTDAGRELALCAAEVVAQLREAGERFDQMRGLRQGELKLGAVSTAKYFAPSLLARFQAQYPGISIRFSVGNRQEMVNRLAANESDLVIMGRPPGEIETVASEFADHPLVIVASPDHPLAGRRTIRLARLAKETFLIREPGSGTRAAMEELFAAKGVGYRSTMEVSSNETIKQAVIAGMGIAFISAHTVGLELEAGRLVQLSVAGLPVVRRWFVIHGAGKRLSPVAAAFRDFLLADAEDLIMRTVVPGPRRRGRRAKRA